MEVRPILSALLRNMSGASLIALQIAFTLAVIANAVFIVQQRLDVMGRETGMDVDNILSISSSAFAPDFDTQGAIRQDLDTLRALPGVVSAVAINQVPLSGSGDSSNYRSTLDIPSHEATTANNYTIDEQGLTTLGVKLAAGRDFRADEVAFATANSGYMPPVVIISQALADELFPDSDAVGKPVYNGIGEAVTVVGVVEKMQGAWVSWDGLERVMLAPIIFEAPYTRYLIRTEPGLRDQMMPVIEQTLAELNDGRIVRPIKTHSEIVARSYSRDRAMTIILTGVVALLIVITTLGIVGLASFSVSQRTKQIGTRRAIGARRSQILRYFLVENWMITTAGIVLGGVLAVVFNYWLVTEYELPKLEFVYMAGGMVALLLLGQLAVLVPARRASRIAPAIATRTV